MVDVLPWLIAMAVLILLSALFSGSEAALFSLTPRGRKGLDRAGIGGRIAAKLLEDPERLLSAVLFWNLLINMTYFAIAAIVGGKLENDPAAGHSLAILFTISSLMTIIFFSEMLPKSLALLAPLRLSILVGPPLSLAVRIVSPALPLVAVTNQAASRLIWPTFEPEPDIDLADIERAIELGTDDAALLQRERMALRGLVEIAETRVDELMRPRSRLWLCHDLSDRSAIVDQPLHSNYMMVTDPDEEMIVKAIGMRMLRPSQMDDLANHAERVIYVPWSAYVSQVLDQLNEEDLSVAVVVNEFGELIGAVSIDDILRRVLAPRHEEDFLGEASVQEIAPGRYRVWGSVSVRSLTKRLGIDVDGVGVTTIAGFIGRHNERVPRLGDTAPMERFTLLVVEQDDDGVWIEARTADENGEVTT
ncbi:CNNM domain-containing protein [Rubripirellula tenax]|uniref:CNNM domain-containing protein n=1 Tax=Rubripirellula tenax TaxID=2528015 RepID=UPI0028F45319|nr:CNNM domain-containing protein [Rubripirellula tenax]